MIPNTADTVSVQSNLDGISGEFSIDESSLAHILSILTNLYSDSEGAIAREYITNAHDSHIEAGQTRPVEVTTPSRFNPTYIVKDFGIGMSVDDIVNTYSKYGASTKRESNDVVGMLGVGSKSALTYTNSFTIIGVKAGIKTQAVVSINDAGVPEFHILDTSATDEPNGVTISIPVKDRNSFATKTADFLQFWPEGAVLVDGHEPTKHDYHKVDESLYIKIGSGYYDRPNSYVVMGNVPYRISDSQQQSITKGNNFGFVAYLPIGSVDIVPSREALHYTGRTVKALSGLADGIIDKYIDTVVDTFSNLTDPLEVLTTYNGLDYNVKTMDRVRKLTWGGEFINNATSGIRIENTNIRFDYNDRGIVSEHSKYVATNRVTNDSLIVVGSEDKPTPTMKRKLSKYFEDNGHNGIIILIENDTNIIWLKNLKRVPLDDIKAVVLPKNKTTRRKDEAPYDTYREVKGDVEYESTATLGNKIAYVSPTDLKAHNRWGDDLTGAEFVQHLPGYTVVVTAANRFEKLIRNHPTAKPLVNVIKDRINELAGKDIQVMSRTDLDHNIRRFVSHADKSRIDDPDLVDFIERATKFNTDQNWDKAQALTSVCSRCSIRGRVSMPDRKKFELATDAYPLLSAMDSWNDDIILYLNAKYADIKEKN